MTPLWRCTASDSRPAGPAVFFVCGLYGAAYTVVRLICRHSESYLRDLGVVRLIPRAAYSPEITVV